MTLKKAGTRRFLGVGLAAAMALCAVAGSATAVGAAGAFTVYKELEPNVEFWSKAFVDYTNEKIVYHDPVYMELIYSVLDVGDIMRGSMSDGAKERAISNRRRAETNRVIAMLRRIASSGPSTEAERKIVQQLKAHGQGSSYARTLSGRVRNQRGLGQKFCPAMHRAAPLLPLFRAIMKRHGVPEDLAALPLVESSYSIGAHSSVGALGMWQFMYSTGKMFLNINSYVDERRDPLVAADAAARLLRSNYDALGTWPLAITAYNHGQAGMARAVRTLGTTHLGIISRKYQGRTFGFASRNFYAEFLAARDAVARREAVCGPLPTDPLSTEAIVVDAWVPFSDLARAAAVSTTQLAELNPALKPAVVSGSYRVPKGYTLRIPRGRENSFRAAYAALPSSSRLAKAPNYTRYHKVRPGQTLGQIARTYKTSVSNLQRMNGIRDPRRLRSGQSLKVPGSDYRSSSTTVVASSTPPAAPKAAPAAAPVVVASVAKPAAAPKAVPATPAVTHRVARGQTLGSIARRHGTSVERLKAQNGIRDVRKLRVGQVLEIRPGTPSVVASAPPTRPTQSHKVASGQTLASIARRYGSSARELQSLNGIRDPRKLRAGQILRVPGKADGPSTVVAAAGSANTVTANGAATIVTAASGDETVSVVSGEAVRVARVVNDGEGVRAEPVPTRNATDKPTDDGLALVAMAASADASGTGKESDLAVVAAGRAGREAASAAMNGETGKGRPSPNVQTVRHTVGRGQTLSQIATLYKTNVADIQRINGIDDPRRMRAGQEIQVPSRGGSVVASSAPALREHKVSSGDSLWTIASAYGTSVGTLQRINGMGKGSRIRAGQVLRIPGTSGGSDVGEHKVGRGQTLTEIARMYRTSVTDLQRLNGIRDPRSLRQGQVLKVP